MKNGSIIFVTGGAGFVGTNLCLSIKAEYPSSKVIAFDNLKRAGSELNLPRLKDGDVQFVHGDVRNPSDMEAFEPDWIIECSAEPSAMAGHDGSVDYLVQTNLLGTYHCLELARKKRSKMIFLSTSRVYPFTTISELKYQKTATRFELDETDIAYRGVSKEGIEEIFPLEGKRTLYGATKLSSELLIAEYASAFEVGTITNRCGVLTGPWQMGKIDQGVVVLWMAHHFFGKDLSYIGFGGNGRQVRDILHVDDLADLVLLQMREFKRYQGNTYNVGGGAEISVSLCELTEYCRHLTGRKVDIKGSAGNRYGDIPWYISNTRKVTNETGWQPVRKKETILCEIHEWISLNEERLGNILI